MKKLLNAILFMLALVFIVSCNDEDVSTPANDNLKKSTKITIDQARQDLMGLLSDLDKDRARTMNKLPRTIKEGHSFKLNGHESRSEETPDFYVFNFENEQGFAIMSGDERIPSLLALTDSGSFNENDSIDNPGMQIFMSNLRANRYDSITIKPNPGGVGVIDWGDTEYKVYGDWQNTVYKKGGYCHVKWGQDAPYNTYTFTTDGRYAQTGCVATAIAQLMSVFHYPESYNGYEFLWDEMTQKLHADQCTTSSRDMIARLMQQLGLPQNLQPVYGVDATSTKLININRTLINFGYSQGGMVKDYSISDIENEINLGYPVFVYGNNKENDSKGHLWLVHGLLKRARKIEVFDIKTNILLTTYSETEYYPMCNWGLEGIYDGYYLNRVFNAQKGPVYNDNLTIPSPSNKETTDEMNFRYDFKTITGIRK